MRQSRSFPCSQHMQVSFALSCSTDTRLRHSLQPVTWTAVSFLGEPIPFVSTLYCSWELSVFGYLGISLSSKGLDLLCTGNRRTWIPRCFSETLKSGFSTHFVLWIRAFIFYWLAVFLKKCLKDLNCQKRGKKKRSVSGRLGNIMNFFLCLYLLTCFFLGQVSSSESWGGA